MGAGGKQQWAVIVPLKPLDSGKSRLGAEARRSELALAFARDVVTAALACPGVAEVVVVTDDPRATAVLRSDGARVVSDVGQGLNAAFEHGATAARIRTPDIGLVALAGDLPALTSDELHRALTQAWDRRRCYVADADGVGTSMLTARPGIGLNASFGVGSSDEHLASGAYLLDVDDCPGLRRDVDTPADLEAVIALGVGVATAAVLTPPES
ncbi:MAG: 2-phospho-L-lactate guanylyltransferase [Actinomycetes bacterium]